MSGEMRIRFWPAPACTEEGVWLIRVSKPRGANLAMPPAALRSDERPNQKERRGRRELASVCHPSWPVHRTSRARQLALVFRLLTSARPLPARLVIGTRPQKRRGPRAATVQGTGLVRPQDRSGGGKWLR